MKTTKRALTCCFLLLTGILSARSQVLVGGAAKPAETLMQLYALPNFGTFFSAQSDTPPLPFDPVPGAALFQYGPASRHTFIYNGSSLSSAKGGAHAMDENDDDGPPSPEGSPSPGGGPIIPLYNYTTNDLWLEIDGVTNQTAEVVLHPPWNVTNGVYDLFYTTNLAPGLQGLPIPWQFVLRTAPGQTNLFPTNASDPQGFYGAGQINPSEGTDFWVAFLGMLPGVNYQLSLYISSVVTNSATITIPGLGFSNSFSIAPGTVANVNIPLAAIIPLYNSVTTNGIHITSSNAICVYPFSYIASDSASFNAYPTTMLGTNYCVLARPADLPGSGPYYSELGVLATANNTTVTIRPSVIADLAGYSGITSTNITLQTGQTYQIKSSSDTGDVTGTLITSDKPIAVFAGANLAYVPNTNIASGNPLIPEQLPIPAWGTQVLAFSFGRPGGDSYRVLAATSNTVITITSTNGVLVFTNSAGIPYDTVLDGPVEFQGSNPIQVAHFAQGGTTDVNLGDPCELLLPPIGHFLTSYVLAIPAYGFNSTGDFTDNFLNLIVPQSAIATTLLDGSIVASTNFMVITNSGYSAARVSVTTGTHTVSSSQPFEVEVYGFGIYDAFGYIGGLTEIP